MTLLDKLQGGVQAGAVADVPNELNVFGGFAVINDLTSDRSSVFGLEYRFRPVPHSELSGSVLDDAAGPDGRHVGLTAEAWVVQDFLSRQLSVGLGIGPYQDRDVVTAGLGWRF